MALFILFQPYLLASPRFIDYFLFGIPQNRCAVNKILRCRFLSSISGDNWCSSSTDYLYHYRLYHTKCFSNSIRKFYDTFSVSHPYTSFTPEIIAEYYPSFYHSLPKNITAFDEPRFRQIEDILHFNYGLTVESFYDSNCDLLHFDHLKTPAYAYYRHLVSLYFKSFSTKRHEYYNKYGTGESPPPPS